MNTKVPSLKDQGKEYDGFTITITGDKYVCFLSVGVKAGWCQKVRRHLIIATGGQTYQTFALS